MKTLFKFATTLSVALLFASTACADVWDETANGGGDAGDFPTGGFQTVASNTVFDQITGVLDPVDSDAYLITITAVDWDIEVQAGTEADTRLWLFDLAGNLLQFNDDSSQTGGALHSALSDTATFPGGGGLFNSPIDPAVGQQVILVVNGFAEDAVDDGGINMTDSSTNFDALHGVQPASSGVFGNWEGANQGGGTYDITLSGAEFGTVPEPGSLSLIALGLAGFVVARRRRK